VTVFRLCGHAAKGPRLVFDQSNCRINPPSSPPPAGNDPPDPADTPWFGNGPPFEKWVGINDEKSFIAAFVPSRATLAQRSPGINPVVGCHFPACWVQLVGLMNTRATFSGRHRPRKRAIQYSETSMVELESAARRKRRFGNDGIPATDN
jgi:hypothetical protein